MRPATLTLLKVVMQLPAAGRVCAVCERFDSSLHVVLSLTDRQCQAAFAADKSTIQSVTHDMIQTHAKC